MFVVFAGMIARIVDGDSRGGTWSRRRGMSFDLARSSSTFAAFWCK